MLALTLWRPWDTAILRLGKPLENRDWRPPAHLTGKRFALHSGKTWDGGAVSFITSLAVQGGMDGRAIADHIDHARDLHSVILGTVKLARVIERAQPSLAADPLAANEWFFGDFGWVCEDPFALPEPVPCKGMQGLWSMPPDVEARVLAQEAARD